MGGHKVEGMEEVPVRLFGQVQVEGMRLREAHISGRIGVNDDLPASSVDVRVCARYPSLEFIVLVLVFRRRLGPKPFVE